MNRNWLITKEGLQLRIAYFAILILMPLTSMICSAQDRAIDRNAEKREAELKAKLRAQAAELEKMTAEMQARKRAAATGTFQISEAKAKPSSVIEMAKDRTTIHSTNTGEQKKSQASDTVTAAKILELIHGKSLLEKEALLNNVLVNVRNPGIVTFKKYRGGAVHGTVIHAKIINDDNVNDARNHLVYMPNIELKLRNSKTGVTVATTRTDYYGRYYFPRQPAGMYQLYWEKQNGWAAGMYRGLIPIKNGNVFPQQIQIRPQEGRRVITGKVKFSNTIATPYINSFFNVVKSPVVEALSNQALITSNHADYRGDYALSVDMGKVLKDLVIRSQYENSQQGVYLTPAQFQSGLPINLKFKNHAPTVDSIVARNAQGDVIRYASPGEEVVCEVQYQDADQNSLPVTWKTPKGLAAFAPQPNGTAKWKLPQKPGLYEVYGMVRDGHGGYATGQLTMRVGIDKELFSGTVIDKRFRTRLGLVEVEINGQKTLTDNNGFFSMNVKVDERYVINFRKDGYALYSQSVDHPSRGKQWAMVRAYKKQVDPANDIILVDERPSLKECGKPGAVVRIKANSLVDARGNLPAGPLSGFITTLNIASNEGPGDFAGRVNNESEVGLISYGMADILFKDINGKTYNLRKGSTAELEIPVATAGNPVVLQQAPEEIPIWSYNEVTGYWEISGNAKLDRNRKVYIGEVSHFSTANMDQPGDVTLIRVLSDPSLLGKTMRVSDVPNDAPDYATVKEVELDDPVNAIYRVPANSKIKIEVLDGPGGNVIANDVVIELFDHNSPQLGWQDLGTSGEVTAGPTVAELWPSYPYEVAPRTIVLKQLPSQGDQSPANAFLVFKGIADQQDAEAYDLLMNPRANANDSGNRGTLQLWWAHNGFSNTGGDPQQPGYTYARTSFMNNNDLGSGRDMHFLERPDGSVASYVSNYGNFNQSHANADLANNQQNLNGLAVATVCMEFSPMETAGGQRLQKDGSNLFQGQNESDQAFFQRVKNASVVKFFVFADLDNAPGDETQLAANLDGYGPKFIPQLCLNCHGGSGNDFTQGSLSGSLADKALAISAADIGARFRELDYKTYKFPNGSLIPDAAEKLDFRIQNLIVKGDSNSAISTAATKEIIDEWYSGGNNDVEQELILVDGFNPNGSNQIGNKTFNDPNKPRELYKQVVGQSCRTCHVAFDNGQNNEFNLSFKAYDMFLSRRGSVQYYINTPPNSFIMPHANVTWRNFWLSGPPNPDQPSHRPTFLRQYSDGHWAQIGNP